MHGAGFFEQAFVYLAATVIAVPLAKRWGLGSVLGYLIAGVLIGPYVMGFIGEEGQDVMHFAEFGVVMMLFVVGLELEPSLLWRMRGPILGLGGAQVGATAVVFTGIGLVFGLTWQVALAIGMILALSSTAIVLQTLNEKGLMKTQAGQSSFAVLLFQDIAVIPMLALMPLLATARGGSGGHDSEPPTLVSELPGWASALVVLGVMTALVASGRFVLAPLFRFIAKARLRETFTAAALLLVIGIALLMTMIGLSPALGTFVAGVVLATSEYRHELEAEIEPFKGLLLGLFFIAVGASIDFGLVVESPGRIFALVGALMVVKFLILTVLARVFRMSSSQNVLFSFALAQGGEFAFVLFSFATQNGVIPKDVASPLIASVALSMAFTPLSMIVNERIILPRMGAAARDERPPDDVHAENPVIVAGYGRFGQVVARLLHTAGYECTLLDIDSDQVDMVRRFGARVYYGDASRIDLLKSAGAGRAKLFVIAIDDHEKALQMAEEVRKHFPHLQILARATGRRQAFDLLDRGVDHVFRETFDSALRMGTDALQLLGMRAYRAHRAARAFRRHDEHSVREAAIARRETEGDITSILRNKAEELNRVLSQEYHRDPEREAGWDTEGRRKADQV